MTTLVISDLHLSSDFPQRTQMLSELLAQHAEGIDALYILGDLFDYWIGDDGLDRLGHRPVVNLIRSIADRGVHVFFMHGNRDFLIGDEFCLQTGASMLSDPCVLDVEKQRVLLCHGDHLCTEDIAHQQFRRQVLDDAWQREILSQPLEQRHQFAKKIRATSDIEKQNKSDAIMDVTGQAVIDEFVRHNCQVIIHGHTHRPAIHETRVADSVRWRLVLGDWQDSPSYLKIGADAVHLESGSGRANASMGWPVSDP